MIGTSILLSAIILTGPINNDGFLAYVNRKRCTEQERVRVVEPKKPKSVYEDLGQFQITAYAEDEITATGTSPSPYYTVAVDPDVIPLGTTLYIQGIGEVHAEDTGGAVQGNVIDLFVGSTESETDGFGRQIREVYVRR